MARYLGKGQIGVCQRSGIKMKRCEMIEDGQVKGLLVHPDWWEPYHPQLVPPPMRPDGLPKQRPAPDEVSGPTTSALSGVSSAHHAVLTWSQANSGPSYITQYQIYRNVNGGLYSLLATIVPTMDTNFNLNDQFWQEVITYGSPYTDLTSSAGNTYGYYVVATAFEGGSSTSNIVSVIVT